MLRIFKCMSVQVHTGAGAARASIGLFTSKAKPSTSQAVEMLRIPHCLDNRPTDDGEVVSPTHRPRSTPEKHYFSASGTNFC
jgi:hypothetical protein